MRHRHKHRVGFIALDELGDKTDHIIGRGFRIPPVLARLGGFQIVFLGNFIYRIRVLLEQLLSAFIRRASDHPKRLVFILVLALFNDVGSDIELDEAKRRTGIVFRCGAHIHAIVQANIADGMVLIPFEEFIDPWRHLRRSVRGDRGVCGLSGAVSLAIATPCNRRASKHAHGKGGTSLY